MLHHFVLYQKISQLYFMLNHFVLYPKILLALYGVESIKPTFWIPLIILVIFLISPSIYTNFLLVRPYNKSSLTNILRYLLIFPFQEYKRWGFFNPLINLYKFLLVGSHNKLSLMNILWYLLTFPFQKYKKWGWDRIEN